MDDLLARLPDLAEWADANEWETPITLGDHLDAAADALEAADKRIAELEAAQRWIPVKERLPENDLPSGSKKKQIKVLTAIKNSKGVYTVRTQLRMRDYWIQRPDEWAWKYSGGDITHWQKLPQPPQKG